MRTGGHLRLFDDGGAATPHRVPSRYDITTIQLPIAVFVGGRDSVIDAKKLLTLLPPTAEVHRFPLFEHLDMFWADDAKNCVFPKLAEFLSRHACDTFASGAAEVLRTPDLRGAPRALAYSM